jgi:hypothetical protein
LLSFVAEYFVFILAYKNITIKIYRTVIAHVVLCGCEIWSVKLREEHRLKVFENRVPRTVYGPRGTRREESGGMHNEKLCDL